MAQVTTIHSKQPSTASSHPQYATIHSKQPSTASNHPQQANLVEAAAEGQEVGHVAEMLREVVLGFHEESALAGGVYWPRLARFPGPHFAPIAHLGWEFGMAPRLRAAAGGGLAGFVLVDGARPL